jgi:hypothetical protein
VEKIIMKSSSGWLLLATAVSLSQCGCRQVEDQITAEHRTVQGLVTLLALHDAQFPQRPPTNLAQLFLEMGATYPHASEQKFRSYGRHSGFTNSFYEKYVLVPKGTRHRFVRGELALLNARPFPDTAGRLGRILVSREGGDQGGYRVDWFKEAEVQQIFEDVGREIPKPVLMPPPPPGPPPQQERVQVGISEGVKVMFGRMAEMIGLEAYHWGTMLVVTASLALLAIALSILWCGRRNQHPNQSGNGT